MLLLVLIVTFLIVLYKFATKNNNYWEKRNVVHEKPTFFFGNVKDVMLGSKNIGLKYTDLYRKFKNSLYVGYFRLSTPGVIIKDPELIKSVLHKDFQSFEKNDFEVDADLDPLTKTNIFMQHGEEWKKNRSAWTQGMTSNKLRVMFDILISKSDIMIDYIKKYMKTNPDEPVDAKDLASNLFIDVVVTSVFGLKINSFELKVNPFKRIANILFVPSLFDTIQTMMFILSPKLAKFLKIRFIPKTLHNEVINLAKDILKIRQQSGFDKNNAFDVILQAEKKDTKRIEIDSGGLVMNFIIDGTETSAVATGFMLYALAANPHVQTKLRNELNAHAKENDGKITYENINQLPYLDMVLSETLRLYPPALALFKICTKQIEFPPAQPGGKPVIIESGTPIGIPVHALHTDPEYYTDPEKFYPERFSDENKEKLTKYTFLPFGDGPRACIGMRMAQNQMKVGIATIIRNFEVRLAPKMQNKTLEFEPTAFILSAVGGLWITFHELDK